MATDKVKGESDEIAHVVEKNFTSVYLPDRMRL
jgi:hypothetical protein